MTFLLIGGGGREYAVARQIAQSPLCDKIWCAPGNGGTAAFCENVPVGATDLPGVLAFCRDKRPDLVAVLPDDPLALGMADLLRANDFLVFGPNKAAAEIESSKAFAKAFMGRHGIKTAPYVTHGAQDAPGYAEICELPVVVKADGLALGKGVFICHTREQAREAVRALCDESAFKSAGRVMVFERFLTGPEVSAMVFTDGTRIAAMPGAQDHKRAFDGDRGPNTGGMGAYTPVPAFDAQMQKRCMEEIIRPTVDGLRAEGRAFAGVLYVSLMLTPDGPYVIEYNARFGDPEAQAVLPLLQSDLAQIFVDIARGSFAHTPVEWAAGASCCVVAASGGYPGAYEKGFPITGIERAEARGCTVCHAGTALREGALVTAGGRVLCVQACAATLREAVHAAYDGVRDIGFEGLFYRTDIAARALDGRGDAAKDAPQKTRG